MPGIPGINVALPARATQTVARGLVSGSSAVVTGLVTSGFFIAIVTAAYILIRKGITAYRKSHLLNQVGENSAAGLAVGYATRLYTAMISGYAWWSDYIGDGTDEEAMYQVAREMKANGVTFGLVSSQYKVLYSRELMEDVTSELDSEQMQKFQAILTTGLGGLGNVAPSRHHLLYTTQPTTVYDHELRAVGPVPAMMRLGEHTETMMSTQGELWHGFPYRDLIRFVPAASVNRIEL